MRASTLGGFSLHARRRPYLPSQPRASSSRQIPLQLTRLRGIFSLSSQTTACSDRTVRSLLTRIAGSQRSMFLTANILCFTIRQIELRQYFCSALTCTIPSDMFLSINTTSTGTLGGFQDVRVLREKWCNALQLNARPISVDQVSGTGPPDVRYLARKVFLSRFNARHRSLKRLTRKEIRG